ncbi:MAG: hypothetical protein HGA19_22720, partial [Oscillochloris sp.]|nr:hypothetical protein [Oscillochloris sp.]
FDYLADEVFERQPPAVRQFLLHTSILERLCGPLCAAILDEPEVADVATATAMLRALEQASLFVVPLDAGRYWYRYHHLFRSFLADRLNHEAPEIVATLHQRASAWCIHHGQPVGALEHAFAAGESEHAIALIEQLALSLIERGEYTTLQRWLNRVPAQSRAAHPALDLWEAWTALLTGRVEHIAPALGRAMRTWRCSKDQAQRGALTHLRAHLARLCGEADPTITIARQALADLPATEVTLRAGSLLDLGAGQLRAGDLTAASATLEDALAYCTAHHFLDALATHTALGDLAARRGQYIKATTHYEQVRVRIGEREIWERWVATARLGEIAREHNRLDVAYDLLHTALEAAEHAGVAVYMITDYIAYARTLQARNDYAGATQALVRARQHARHIGSIPYQRQVQAFIARLDMANGDLNPYWQPAGSPRPTENAPVNEVFAIELLTLARLHIIWMRNGMNDSCLPETTNQIIDLYHTAMSYGHVANATEAALLVALAADAIGHMGEASRWLDEALTLAEPAGYLRLFLDEGPAMAKLLRKIRDTSGKRKDAATQILAAFPEQPLDSILASQPSALGPQPLTEPLSEREIAVLQLVAAGASNQDIATSLVISVGTVKSHINHILGKLAARNRTEAVARARTLGLLI